jgi:hypothetical protein
MKGDVMALEMFVAVCAGVVGLYAWALCATVKRADKAIEEFARRQR